LIWAAPAFYLAILPQPLLPGAAAASHRAFEPCCAADVFRGQPLLSGSDPGETAVQRGSGFPRAAS
jgi:hypothetical protein